MANLILSIVTLAIGPVLVSLARGRRQAMVAVDSFVLVVIGGLVLTHILPEALRAAGAWALLAAILGFVAPSIAEKTLHHDHGGVRRTAAALALLGLFVHAAVDGMGLKGHFAFDAADRLQYHPTGVGPLTWAILLHRIPVGIAIWWIVPRTLGRPLAALAMGVVILGTIVGWGLGPEWVTGQPDAAPIDGTAPANRAWSWVAAGVFQSLLGGSLLHVLMHAHVPPPNKAAPPPTRALQWPSLFGALLAVATVTAILASHQHSGPGGARPGAVFVGLALTSAPPLVFAFIAVGLANAFLPVDWTDRLRQGRPVTQALKGVLVGLPLPVCSCGVVPLYRELVQKGAAVAAAMAFLIATPELEIAAVFLTWELMGPEVAVARVVMAAALALVVALLVSRLAPPMDQTPEESCCHGGDEPDEADAKPRWRTVLWTGFGDAVDNTGAWILIGLGISAYLVPYVDPEWLARLPNGLDVPAAALLGLPLYVCASGSTPLAAVMIAQGLSPGAALAFLITGPATNATTYGLLKSLHGARTATIFSLSMLVGATAAGLLANLVLPHSGDAMPHLHEHGGTTLEWLCLAILAIALVGALLRKGVRSFVEQILGVPGGGHHHDDENHGDHAPGAASCH